MPKVVSDGEKRVPLNCLIGPATRGLIEKLRGQKSQGEFIDDVVGCYSKGQIVFPGLSDRSRPEPKQERQSTSNWRANRKPLLRPKEKNARR